MELQILSSLKLNIATINYVISIYCKVNVLISGQRAT